MIPTASSALGVCVCVCARARARQRVASSLVKCLSGGRLHKYRQSSCSDTHIGCPNVLSFWWSVSLWFVGHRYPSPLHPTPSYIPPTPTPALSLLWTFSHIVRTSLFLIGSDVVVCGLLKVAFMEVQHVVTLGRQVRFPDVISHIWSTQFCVTWVTAGHGCSNRRRKSMYRHCQMNYCKLSDVSRSDISCVFWVWTEIFAFTIPEYLLFWLRVAQPFFFFSFFNKWVDAEFFILLVGMTKDSV